MGGVDDIQDNVRGFTEFGNDPQPVALRVAKKPYEKMEKKNFVDDVQWWNLGNLVPAPPDMGHDPHGSWMNPCITVKRLYSWRYCRCWVKSSPFSFTASVLSRVSTSK